MTPGEPGTRSAAGAAGAEPPVAVGRTARLRAAAEARRPAIVADLEQLVAIESGTFDKPGVDEAGRLLAARLAGLGATVTVHPHLEHGDTVVGTLRGGAPGGARILLVGHLDTVFDRGTVAERPLRVEGDRALGPGVVDMKGGLAVALHALGALLDVAGGPAGLPLERIEFLANGDEEVGSPSSTPVLREAALAADAVLVLEAARTDGSLVAARKGIVDLRVVVTGRSAHAGVDPGRGRSAVMAGAALVGEIAALAAADPGVTVNVGIIAGGTRTNVVAERCEIDLEVRAERAADLARFEDALRAALPAAAPEGIGVELEVLSRIAPMERGPGTERLVGHAVAAAAELGMALRAVATGGGSDANTTAGLGIPTLDGLGPVGGADHSPEEYLDLDSLVPRTALLAALVLAIARDPHLVRRPA